MIQIHNLQTHLYISVKRANVMPTLQFLKVKVFQKGSIHWWLFCPNPTGFFLKRAASVCSWRWGCPEHGYWMVESETKLRAVTEVKRMSMDQQKQMTAVQTLWPKTKGNHYMNKMYQHQDITSQCKTSGPAETGDSGPDFVTKDKSKPWSEQDVPKSRHNFTL